ncbi:MAG: hypothetical protein UW73_C0002G0002 [Microgenomates group bacterium GW2011_GWB1_44_8]|nr:MAG: hypothetical protein UW73_C0002G0002 [Microgenomates group bacterium GW2011_GWB1_44_8]
MSALEQDQQSSGERYNRDKYFLAELISDGKQLFRKEMIRIHGWKYLAWCRHLASLALAEPCLWYSNAEALRWVTKYCNVIGKAEIKPCINEHLVLPFPDRTYKLGSWNNPNPESLPWYEPSVNFQMIRVGEFLDNKNVVVGTQTGKWRFIHMAHMAALWYARQRCDVLVVGCDVESLDRKRVNDGFLPELEEKVNMLHAIQFPDGRRIDLIIPVVEIFPNPTVQIGRQTYWPFYFPTGYFTTMSEKLAHFLGDHEVILWRTRFNLPDEEIQMLDRLVYFVSVNDTKLEAKQLMAASSGIKVTVVPYLKWQGYVSTSRIVKRFGLRT